MDSIQIAVRRGVSLYASFQGRASRPEFWWWWLAVLLFFLVLGLIDTVLFGDESQPLSFVASLAIILPNLAIGVRRLHDTGRSGWWILIGLIPVIGFFVLLYFYVQQSEDGENDFGPQPHWPPSA